MRRLASFLLVVLAVPALAGEAWRWKDERGVVHYSDTPVPGAERIILAVPPSASSGTPSAPVPTPAAPRPTTPEKFRYTECVVLAPGNEQVFNAVSTITASLQIAPDMLPEHHIQVILDGNPYNAWPGRMLTFKIEDLDRGTHTLAAQVVDAKQRVICDGSPTTFHVHQPSVLKPKAKPKP